MITRYLASGSLGLVVATGLLWLMQFLIDIGPEVFVAEPPKIRLAWIADRKPEVVNRDPEQPQRLPPPVRPPQNRPPVDDARDGTPIDLPPTAPPDPDPAWQPTGPGMSDGPLVAMMTVRPVYPVQAATRAIEGYVIVEFDVDPSGLVVNVVVIESSHGLFERSAVDAALRSKVRSRVVDGIAVMTTGIRKLYRFKLDE